MMRRTRLKPVSDKTRQRNAEAKPVRDALKERIRRCEICLRSREPDALAGHEIANGNGLRLKALDQPYAILLVCRYPDFQKQRVCHDIVQKEPEPRQLARLYLVDQSRYDLTAYNQLVNENAPLRIEQWEVDREIESLLAAGQYGRVSQ